MHDIDDGRVEGKEFSFSVTVEMGGNSMTLSFTGTLKDDALSGTVNGPMGEHKWKATKVDP